MHIVLLATDTTNKKKERNLRFSLQYPEPGSNRHRGEPTGV